MISLLEIVEEEAHYWAAKGEKGAAAIVELLCSWLQYPACTVCGYGFAVPMGWDNDCRCFREAHLCKCHDRCEQ